MADNRINVILGADDRASKVVTGLRGQFALFKRDAMAGFGLGAGIGVFTMATRALGGVVDIAGDAINAAANLEESQSKVGAVFVESADQVLAWADDLESSFGLTEQAALESAGTIGNFVKALGGTEDEARKVGIAMTELAGDLGSFNNVATDEVLVSLRAGLAGETEPMRRLGVDISAARVESILLAQGIQKVNGQFRESDKVMARYRAIMEQTATAQGDAARTADTLRGQQRKLQAEMGDALADLGAILMPVAAGFVGFLVDVIDLSPDYTAAAAAIIEKMYETQAAAKGLGEEVAEFVTAYEPLTELDLPAFTKVGMWHDYTAALLEAANRARLTTQDVFDMTLAVQENEDGIKLLIQTLHDAYYAYDPLSSIVTETAQAMDDGASDIKSATRKIITGVGDLAPGMRQTILDGRADVREAMTSLRFAMEHPFQGQKYINFLKDKQEAANRKLVAALKAGKIAGANEAAAIVNSIQTELDRLDDQTYNVGVFVDVTTGRRKSGAAPGRASGGPVSPGQSYLVGERGPEVLHMGNQGGYVQANAGGGGGHGHVIVMDGRVVGELVDARLGRRSSTLGRDSAYRSSN